MMTEFTSIHSCSSSSYNPQVMLYAFLHFFGFVALDLTLCEQLKLKKTRVPIGPSNSV